MMYHNTPKRKKYIPRKSNRQGQAQEGLRSITDNRFTSGPFFLQLFFLEEIYSFIIISLHCAPLGPVSLQQRSCSFFASCGGMSRK